MKEPLLREGNYDYTNYYSMGIDSYKSFCQMHILNLNGSDVYKGHLKEYDPVSKLLEIRLERTSLGGLGCRLSRMICLWLGGNVEL